MSWITGFITKNVSSSESPTSTCVGGTCCVPSAVRTNESTITMRVNEVSSTSIVGASLTTVSSSRICSESATSDGLVAGLTPMLTRGIGIVGLAGPDALRERGHGEDDDGEQRRPARRGRSGDVGSRLLSESLQEAEHRIALLAERLPLRLDVGFDDVTRDVGDVCNPGGSSAYQIVSVADLHDVKGHVLRQ